MQSHLSRDTFFSSSSFAAPVLPSAPSNVTRESLSVSETSYRPPFYHRLTIPESERSAADEYMCGAGLPPVNANSTSSANLASDISSISARVSSPRGSDKWERGGAIQQRLSYVESNNSGITTSPWGSGRIQREGASDVLRLNSAGSGRSLIERMPGIARAATPRNRTQLPPLATCDATAATAAALERKPICSVDGEGHEGHEEEENNREGNQVYSTGGHDRSQLSTCSSSSSSTVGTLANKSQDKLKRKEYPQEQQEPLVESVQNSGTSVSAMVPAEAPNELRVRNHTGRYELEAARLQQLKVTAAAAAAPCGHGTGEATQSIDNTAVALTGEQGDVLMRFEIWSAPNGDIAEKDVLGGYRYWDRPYYDTLISAVTAPTCTTAPAREEEQEKEEDGGYASQQPQEQQHECTSLTLARVTRSALLEEREEEESRMMERYSRAYRDAVLEAAAEVGGALGDAILEEYIALQPGGKKAPTKPMQRRSHYLGFR